MSQKAYDRAVILVTVFGVIVAAIVVQDRDRLYALAALVAVPLVASRPEAWAAINRLARGVRSLHVFGILDIVFGYDPVDDEVQGD